MKFKQTLLTAALVVACGFANAVTLRVSNVGDVQSMDPHSLNETLQLSSLAEIPDADEEVSAWLNGWWGRIDGWIDERGQESPARAGLESPPE